MAALMVMICALWIIPLIAGLTMNCRHWCGIVSLAIAIGYGAGLVIGPLIVRYRYQELYWNNPGLVGEAISGALAAIILSLPASILATWAVARKSRTVNYDKGVLTRKTIIRNA
jgi:hypothetical protein